MSEDEKEVVEFIPAEEFDARMNATSEAYEDGKVTVIPRAVSRKEVAQNFAEAFQQIGGVMRLTQWADQNESEFFRLYSRLLPSQASSALGETNEITIRHVLPRSTLDE